MIFAQENATNATLSGMDAGPHREALSSWAAIWGPPGLLLQHGSLAGAGFQRNSWLEWPTRLLAASGCARVKVGQGRRDALRVYALGRVGTVVLPLIRLDLRHEKPSDMELHELAAMQERVRAVLVARLQALPVTPHQALEMRLRLPGTMRSWEAALLAKRPLNNALRKWSNGELEGTAWDLLAAVRAECLACRSQARHAADAVIKAYHLLRNLAGGDL
jgi:hypothetical protein